jgi:SpoVK/Ycf46/Vps4 family AAA+-type ATPase
MSSSSFQVQVSKLISDDHALDNVLNHNQRDFPGSRRYFRLNQVVYPSIPVVMESGFIGVGGIVRTRMNLALGDSVSLTEVKPVLTPMVELTVNISLRTKNLVSIHEDEFREKIREKFCDYFFCPGQVLLMETQPRSMIPEIKPLPFVFSPTSSSFPKLPKLPKLPTLPEIKSPSTSHGDQMFILTVTSPHTGLLGPRTIINLVPADVHLNLVSPKLLKRDLFRDDYNFEEIGIGGLNMELVQVFRQALATRAVKPELADKLGVKHVKGILLYGPPGCGKSLIARKIGSMISPQDPQIVNGPEIMNKYVGQSEENIRNLFSDARANPDSSELHVIIFDEIDAICKSRGQGINSAVNDSVVNQLLSMIDGVEALNNIFIIAMTNRKELLDEALLRAGRLEIHIEISLPNRAGRQEILRIHTNKMRNSNLMSSDVDLARIAEMTDNFSGAEIEAVVKRAASQALQEQLASNKPDVSEADVSVTMTHFVRAISEVTPLFGHPRKQIQALLPDPIYSWPSWNTLCSQIQALRQNERGRPFHTVLIIGSNGGGKTTFLAQVGSQQAGAYTRLVRAIDLISHDEMAKSRSLVEIVTNAYQSDDSLILLDDLEILLNYAKVGFQVTFSNRLYQTLMTILKTAPPRGHRLTLIGTCADAELAQVIGKSFDLTYTLEDVDPVTARAMIESEVDDSLPIRDVLQVMSSHVRP